MRKFVKEGEVSQSTKDTVLYYESHIISLDNGVTILGS
jgi:hypothetical protein